jgi:molecular chaperone GrpE
MTNASSQPAPGDSGTQSGQETASGVTDTPAAAATAEAAGSGETAPSETAAPSLEQQLAEALARVQAWEAEYLRARADMENLRKRSAQEVQNAGKFAIESFAEALLPVADSLEMALSLENQTSEGLRSGVELTLRQMQQAFQKGRLTAIHPQGEKFDPRLHQAVSMVPGADQQPPVPSGHVVQVMQKGYMVAERVLRPAIVVVAQ